MAKTAALPVRKRRITNPAVSVAVNRNSGARRSLRPSAHAAVSGPATTRLNAAIDRTRPISAPEKPWTFSSHSGRNGISTPNPAKYRQARTVERTAGVMARTMRCGVSRSKDARLRGRPSPA